MGRTKEKISKNPKRDDIGTFGNMAWEPPILFPKVSQENGTFGCVKLNNPVSNRRIRTNSKPP